MNQSGDPRAVITSVQRALGASAAFRQLDGGRRRELTDALAHIGRYIGADPLTSGTLAEPMPLEGDPGTGNGSRGTSGGGPTGRVGELARATLNAIDFPSFVSALIKGTFQAIVDATIQQMEAYATLLKEVAKTVDEYMEDNVTDDAAKDYLVDRYSNVFTKDTSTGTAQLEVNRADPTAALPSFFSNLGFDNPAQLDPVSVDTVVVPAARKTIAEQRHQTLATMVLLGLNRIVVDDGEINAKLQFHIDASETTAITFAQTQTTLGNIAGVAGGSQFTGQGIMVNTTNVNAQSDINLRTDLTGEVRIKFSSDVLPLARFADSNAIQLINQHATVPTLPPTTTPESSNGEPANTGANSSVAPQSLAATVTSPADPRRHDPWSPVR